MKISKFNENVNTKYCYCSYTINDEVDESHIFENEEDMYNWILNFINSEIPNNLIDDDNYEDFKLIKVDDDEYLFLDVVDALNFFNRSEFKNINYDIDIDIIKVVKLKYGVEQLRDVKKYNL